MDPQQRRLRTIRGPGSCRTIELRMFAACCNKDNVFCHGNSHRARPVNATSHRLARARRMALGPPVAGRRRNGGVIIAIPP